MCGYVPLTGFPTCKYCESRNPRLAAGQKYPTIHTPPRLLGRCSSAPSSGVYQSLQERFTNSNCRGGSGDNRFSYAS